MSLLKTSNLDFNEVESVLKAGHLVRRLSWNDGSFLCCRPEIKGTIKEAIDFDSNLPKLLKNYLKNQIDYLKILPTTELKVRQSIFRYGIQGENRELATYNFSEEDKAAKDWLIVL